MSPIDCCCDGVYFVAGHYYILDALKCYADSEESIGQENAPHGHRYTSHTLSMATEHGLFRWRVELIEYQVPRWKAIRGYSLTASPPGVVIVEQPMFTLLG